MRFLIGLVVGAFGGLVGPGKGVIMVPRTVFAFKLLQKDTHCTSLVAVVFTIFHYIDIAGAITNASKEYVDYLAAEIV